MGKEISRDSVMVCEVLVLWERRAHGIVLWFVRCWCYGKGELTG